ncbi:MAG: twin-arginine translocation signal domain-containing protein [Planctomycetota bacterium]
MGTGNRERAPIERRRFLKASLAAVGSSGALAEALRAAPAERADGSHAARES